MKITFYLAREYQTIDWNKIFLNFDFGDKLDKLINILLLLWKQAKSWIIQYWYIFLVANWKIIFNEKYYCIK